MEKSKNLKVVPTQPLVTLKRLFAYLKFHKALFFSAILLIFLASGAQIAANGMLSPIIDSLLDGRGVQALLGYLAIMAGLVVVIAGAEYLGTLFMARLAQRIVHRIREELFQKVQSLSVVYFDSHGHGSTMSAFTNDMELLNQALEQSLGQIVTSVVTVAGTFLMMVLLSPPLTGIVLINLGLMFLAIKVIASKSGKNFRKRQGMMADMNSYVEEMVSAQKVVKVFSYEDRASAAFAVKNEQLRVSATDAATYGVMLMPVMGNLSYVMYALVAMLGSVFVIGGSLTVGNIAAFLQYTRTVSRPITMVSNQLNSLLAAIAGAERIFKILDTPPEDAAGDVKLATGCSGRKDLCWLVPGPDGSTARVPVAGFIQFDRVDFGYSDDRLVLNDISLYAKPGQKIALVGSTGAGKTTITNLINRFYEIRQGNITIDSIPIGRIDKFDLRSIMSIVLQDVHLFSGTIMDNIRYGRLNATDEEVTAAAKLANAHDFIIQLKDGYHTELTADGGSLSQGERQLISIARAAIADPIVLILDEATSSVDTRTELAIERGMDELMKGRTTFVIAHRLSTVRHANAIIVLEHGRIVERGDHEDLMNQKGRYYALNMGSQQLD